MDDIPQLQEQWERDWRKPGEELHSFSERSKGSLLRNNRGSSNRVNQLDAIVLDGQVEDLLTTRLLRSLSSGQGGGVVSDEFLDFVRPEIVGVLRLALWAVTVGRFGGVTYGQDLQNIAPTTPLNATRAVAHLFLSVVVPWAASRAEREMTTRRWWEKSSPPSSSPASPGSQWRWNAWRAMRVAETAVRVAALVNFLVFLWRGDHPTLVSRLVFTTPASKVANPEMRRTVLYDQMNRQMFWEGVAELAILSLPLVRSSVIRVQVTRLFSKVRSIGSLLISAGSQSPSVPKSRHPLSNQSMECAICGTSPARTAHRPASCAHVFCFHCIHAAKAADPSLACPVCFSPVSSIVRLSASDLVPPSH